MDDLYDHIFHRQILDWNQGNHCPLEKYLNELGNPEMSPDLLVDLIYHEMRIKLEMAETPDVEDYCRRFPKVQEEIRAQWEFHELLEEEFAEETVETGIGGTSADTLILKPPEIPGYQIYESLGRGATGVVYRALQISLNRIVALKVLHPPSDQSQAESHTRAQKAIELFRQEAERVANLKDDHIVEVYDFGEHEGLLFFAMELADGGSLAKTLKKKPLSPIEAARQIEPIARSLARLHEQQVIHRDLKPANLLRIGEKIKLADFGLATCSNRPSQGRPQIVGTPPYMAPEQTTWEEAEPRTVSDIYALGVTMYEALTGQPPFRGSTPEEIFEQARKCPVPSLRAQQPVPRQLEAICLKCLEKDPKKRYQSAEDLADDLDAFQSGQPIWKLERNWFYKLMLFTRYHRNLFLVALVLLGGIFWTLAANKPDPPAPERSLEELMEKLDKGEPAVVEGSVKLPGPFRVLLGPEGVISRTDPETFRIQSASRSLVQLLPDTRLHEYRLTVDLRHDSGNGNSHVGVFFGFRKTSDAPGRAPELGSFHTLTFAERGNLAMVMSSSEKDYQGQCRFSGYFFKQETGSPIYRKRILGRRSTFRFPGPLDEPGKWRRLVLEVRKDRVSGYWIKGEEEKTLIQSFTHPQIGTEIGKIKRALSDKLAGLRNIQTDFLPRAPIGLYVETGIATFRLVKIEPLEKKSPKPINKRD